MSLQIKGLWVPLVTPILNGNLDKDSLIGLIKKIEPFVDGFVPCLTSGEGEKMDQVLWNEVLKTVSENTSKPIMVGILDKSPEEIKELSWLAKEAGCVAVVIPVPKDANEIRIDFFRKISGITALPVIIYNAQDSSIDDIETLSEIAKLENLVGIKDSSGNRSFFKEVIAAKRSGRLSLATLQGMEDVLLESIGADGYLLSLANIEPELCKEMFYNPSEELNEKVMGWYKKLDMGSNTWYKNIKKELISRNIIKSAELIN